MTVYESLMVAISFAGLVVSMFIVVISLTKRK